MKNNKLLKLLKGIAIALALPVAVFVIMEVLVFLTQGEHVLNSALDVKNLVRGGCISALVSFALSINLSCGRMDLSLGSQYIAGTILGGVIAVDLGLGGIWIFVFALVIGTLLGAVVGLLYVTLRIPPMVLGIGMACIFECIAFAVSDGIGFRLVGVKDSGLLSNINFTIAVVGVILVLMYLLTTYTRFSYNFRAVQGSQRVAQNAGINIFLNVALCYTVGGALAAASGVLNTGITGSLAPSMGMQSVGTVMANMFPMMIGGFFLSRYINQAAGLISASFAVEILSTALIKFNISDAMNSCINMVIYIAFLIYLFNVDRIAQARWDKQRIAQAQEMKRAMAAQ